MPKFSKGVQYYSKSGDLKTITSTFDLVITTQVEFNNMIVQSTWRGAKSVAFVGDGGTLVFTNSGGQGLKIPQTVKQIQGFNSAKIEVTNFVFNGSTNKAALWYESQPTTDDYSIKDLSVSCTGIGGGSGGHGFYNCTQLINCTGTGTGGGIDIGYGFYNCTQLINCTGTGTGGGGYGFYNCTQIINCYGSGMGPNVGYGFGSCTQIINCTGSASSGNGNGGGARGFSSCTQITNCYGSGIGGSGGGYGFSNCTQLTNCTGTGTGTGNNSGYGFSNCTQLTNCTGTGSGEYGYGFSSCSYCNGCGAGSIASATGLWTGTTTKRDDSSCQTT